MGGYDVYEKSSYRLQRYQRKVASAGINAKMNRADSRERWRSKALCTAVFYTYVIVQGMRQIEQIFIADVLEYSECCNYRP